MAGSTRPPGATRSRTRPSTRRGTSPTPLGRRAPGQVIPGGAPNNPLKARWLGIYNGVGIHGTAEGWSIGTRASHGCIRMHVADVVALYRACRSGRRCSSSLEHERPSASTPPAVARGDERRGRPRRSPRGRRGSRRPAGASGSTAPPRAPAPRRRPAARGVGSRSGPSRSWRVDRGPRRARGRRPPRAPPGERRVAATTTSRAVSRTPP